MAVATEEIAFETVALMRLDEIAVADSPDGLPVGGSVDGFNYRINYGNPFLDPFRATSYDVAFEWYFAPQSIFSVALFRKDISSFPVSQTISGTYASTGLPLSVDVITVGQEYVVPGQKVEATNVTAQSGEAETAAEGVQS